LRGEDDGGILLPQRLQPTRELTGEALVVQRQPAFVDDQQRRPAIEAVFDAMKEIGEHGGRSAGADQPSVSNTCPSVAKPLGLGVEQTT